MQYLQRGTTNDEYFILVPPIDPHGALDHYSSRDRAAGQAVELVQIRNPHFCGFFIIINIFFVFFYFEKPPDLDKNLALLN